MSIQDPDKRGEALPGWCTLGHFAQRGRIDEEDMKNDDGECGGAQTAQDSQALSPNQCLVDCIKGQRQLLR
jgi:hypothetical protein